MYESINITIRFGSTEKKLEFEYNPETDDRSHLNRYLLDAVEDCLEKFEQPEPVSQEQVSLDGLIASLSDIAKTV